MAVHHSLWLLLWWPSHQAALWDTLIIWAPQGAMQCPPSGPLATKLPANAGLARSNSHQEAGKKVTHMIAFHSFGPTGQFLNGTHLFSELVLARKALLMDQSRSVLSLRSATARELWREIIVRACLGPFHLNPPGLFFSDTAEQKNGKRHKTAKLYSYNKVSHWLLNNNWHLSTVWYCMFHYGWSVFWL